MHVNNYILKDPLLPAVYGKGDVGYLSCYENDSYPIVWNEIPFPEKGINLSIYG